MSRLRALVVPVALAGAVAMAGVALNRIYSGWLLAALVGGAAIGSVTVSALLRDRPGPTAGPLSVVVLAVYTLAVVPVSARAAGIEDGLLELTADAAQGGIPRLLTALIPVEPQPDTVLVPVVAAWLAGLAGAELAIRGRRVLAGFGPPVLCYAAALYLVGPNAAAAVWPTLGFAVLAMVALAADPHRDRPPDGAGRGRAGSAAHGPPEPAAAGGLSDLPARLAAGSLAALAGLIALAAAVGPVVAGRVGVDPDDPRRHVVPPRLDTLDENPLIRLSGWALAPEQHLLDAVVDRDTRLRLAVLTDYDGVTWRAGSTYRGAGRSLPRSGETPGGATDPVRQQVTVADLSGHLLPATGVPRRVDGLRVAFDTASGTLARPEGLRPGLRYTVVSDRPSIDVNLLPGAEVPAGPAVARLLHLGAKPPEELERLAGQLAEGNAGPYQRAAAIEQFLAEHYRLVADAPSGHAYPNLGFFLHGPREAGGQRGTSEQFAAAFAVLARITGLPSRVVVGFQVAAGRPTVTAADALAWPEVLFTGLGWVPFHPLPEPNAPVRRVEDDFRPKPPPSAPPPSTVPPVEVSLAPPTQKPLAEPPAPGAGSRVLPLIGVVLATGAAAGAIGFAVAVPLLKRRLRRQRLDRGPPESTVAGSWLEVTDALRLAGRSARDHLSATEVGAHAGAAAGLPRSAHRRHRVRLPVPPLDDLVTVVNATEFGPVRPSEAEAGRARRQAVAYAEQLRARRPWWQRLLWTLHPGPLRWHR